MAEARWEGSRSRKLVDSGTLSHSPVDDPKGPDNHERNEDEDPECRGGGDDGQAATNLPETPCRGARPASRDFAATKAGTPFVGVYLRWICCRPRGSRLDRDRGSAIDDPPKEAGSTRLSLVLAAAMFVLVVDTSLMNVSISAVVEDLDTTVSSVQSAIALEALVSAAFILISSKIGDLFGRKRAYVLGLLGYAIGALAMTLAQSLTAIIVFWAIIGGLGASLLLPAMQSLIHGNFEGAAQKKTYALVGAAAAIAAAVGPLLGGFVTTYLSWRVGFLLEAVVIAVVLSQIGLAQGRPVHGRAAGRRRRRGPVGRRHGRRGAGHPGVAGGRRLRRAADRDRRARALGARPLARAAPSRGQGDPARSGSVPRSRTSGSGSPGRCCRTSRSAGR